MKHTPGPWRVLDGAILCKNVNQYGNWIVTGLNRERTAEDDANLLLMSAAPELLEALKYWFDSKADPKKLAQMAQAAIAKAEGGQNDA